MLPDNDIRNAILFTPTNVPCWQVFEPDERGGRLIVSLGFSVRAEPAHQNQ